MAFAGQFGHLAKDEGKDQHGEQGLQEGPGDADDRLLVADGDIAPGEHPEQFAIAPEVTPVVPLGAAGFEDEGMGHVD